MGSRGLQDKRLTPRRRTRVVNPAQRLCGACFSLFILFQTPLFTLPVERNGAVVDVPMSAAEVTAIGAIKHNPEQLTRLAQYMLVPGMWWKAVSRQAFACLTGKPNCEPRGLLDGAALLRASDYTAMVGPFYDTLKDAAPTLVISSAMLVACAVATPVVPDLKVTLVALALFVWSIFTSACGPLPTTAFMGLLAVTAVFGPREQPRPPSPAEVAQAKQQLKASEKAAGSPSKSSKKRR